MASDSGEEGARCSEASEEDARLEVCKFRDAQSKKQPGLAKPLAMPGTPPDTESHFVPCVDSPYLDCTSEPDANDTILEVDGSDAHSDCQLIVDEDGGDECGLVGGVSGGSSGDLSDDEHVDCGDHETEYVIPGNKPETKSKAIPRATLASHASSLPKNTDVVSSDGWRVGSDCGPWLPSRAQAGPQAQVLLTNLYWNLCRLPSKLLHIILSVLVRNPTNDTHVADQVAASLCGVCLQVTRQNFRRVRDAAWKPSGTDTVVASPPRQADMALEEDEPQAAAMDNDVMLESSADEGLGQRLGNNCATQSGEAPPLDAVGTMMVLLREILGNAVRGGYDTQYLRACARYALAGLRIGTRYQSRQFAVSVEHMAMRAVSALTSMEVDELLPALGIPSDFACVFDGVPLGGHMFTPNETLLPIGLVFVSARTGRMRDRLVAAPSIGASKSGAFQRDLVISSLAGLPRPLLLERLRAGMALVGGDGAVVHGGPAMRHNTSGAANLIWRFLFPDVTLEAVDWDLFHRAGVAGKHAQRQVPFAKEVIDVSRVISQLFRVSGGRVLLRGVAATLGLPLRQVAEGTGGRGTGYLPRITQTLLDNFPLYHEGLRARLEQTHGPDRQGSQKLHHLVSVGRRLTSVDFVAFLLLFHDILKIRLEPLMLIVQEVDAEPLTVTNSVSKALGQFRTDLALSGQLRIFVNVTFLLGSYLTERELARFWVARSCLPVCRRFPTFCANAFALIWWVRYKNCELLWQEKMTEFNTQTQMLLSPRCQCVCRRLRPLPAQELDHHGKPLNGARVGPTVPRKLFGDTTEEMKLPEWVVNSPYDGGTMINQNVAHPHHCFPLRFHVQQRNRRAPAQLQGVSMYAHRCRAPVHLRQAN